MVIDKQKLELYPNALFRFASDIGFPIEMIHTMNINTYLDYFDQIGLFIGITCDADGLFWIAEVCSQPLGVLPSREAAEDRAIEECFKMLEDMLNCEIK